MQYPLGADIIVLSWDRIDDTIAAITSALNQALDACKVIVVDQGSKPENVNQLREFETRCNTAKLQCIYLQENLGVAGGRNVAAEHGQYRYIIALDNDAEFADQHQVQRAVTLMESEPETAAFGFRIKCFGEDIDDASSWSYPQVMKQFADKSFASTHFVGAGHILRRDAFTKVGMYDDVLFFMLEEKDLSMRLLNAGYHIRYEPTVEIAHKVAAEHRVQWSGNRWQFNVRNTLYIQLKQSGLGAKWLFSAVLFLHKGIRSQLLTKTLNGIWLALKLMPTARKKAKTNPFYAVSASTMLYCRKCEGTDTFTPWQRFTRRVFKANRRVAK